MFEKFTERARKVMSLARQEAQRSNSEFIGSEHILLGIIVEGGGVAAKVMKGFKIEGKTVRAEVERIITPNSSPIVTLGQLPFSPRAKRVIELAGEESSRMNLDWIGTGQLLVGLALEVEGIASQVLRNLSVNLPDLRKTVEEFEREGVAVTGGGISLSGSPKKDKMVLKMYSKISTKFLDQKVLVVNGETYLESGEITIAGIDPQKRGEVAQAIAKEHGAAIYEVRTIELVDEGPTLQPKDD